MFHQYAGFERLSPGAGGGFVAGSTRAALYDGSAFARDGVVLVTLNYRLGIAGFLDLPGAPANRGLLNGNVTLSGQSAGATIVGSVLATTDAEGLIHRAIVQSGSGLGAFTTEQAARVHDTWVRFATTGDPGWDPYDTERRPTMHIDTEWTQVDDPHAEERRAWI